MPFCQHCGEEIGYLPFKCKYCGGTFCKSHRLPENHKCTFELKHAPVIPDTSRESRPLYQDAVTLKPVSRKDEYKWEKQRRKYQKQQERQRKQAMRSFERGLTGTGVNKGTNFIIIMIIIFSIAATIFALVGIPQYIAFSLYGILNLYLWTIFTAIFVSYSSDFFGLFFLLILIFFLYNIAKNIEMRFGTSFLIKLYVFCASITAVFYILIRILIDYYYPINLIIIPIGLATGAILGLISFIVYFNPDSEMMLFCFFIPVKMKGRTLLIVLILFRVIPGLLFSLFYGPASFAIYFPDLGGILAAYLVFYFKYKSR
ncbi:MAG: rhomboid family intramembrane serine protease [Promethearchaeota archaeon]